MVHGGLAIAFVNVYAADVSCACVSERTVPLLDDLFLSWCSRSTAGFLRDVRGGIREFLLTAIVWHLCATLLEDVVSAFGTLEQDSRNTCAKRASSAR